MRRYLPLVGRILLGLIFVMSGFSKITGFEGTQQHMAEFGVPVTGILLVGAIVVELLGGLSLIFGYWARAGAVLLALFLIPTTLIFHTDFSQQTQMVMFLKNLAIMGGLLFVIAHGSGPFRLHSLDVEQPESAYA